VVYDIPVVSGLRFCPYRRSAGDSLFVSFSNHLLLNTSLKPVCPTILLSSAALSPLARIVIISNSLLVFSASVQ